MVEAEAVTVEVTEAEAVVVVETLVAADHAQVGAVVEVILVADQVADLGANPASQSALNKKQPWAAFYFNFLSYRLLA